MWVTVYVYKLNKLPFKLDELQNCITKKYGALQVFWPLCKRGRVICTSLTK